jgi:hypothetical protein
MADVDVEQHVQASVLFGQAAFKEFDPGRAVDGRHQERGPAQ